MVKARIIFAIGMIVVIALMAVIAGCGASASKADDNLPSTVKVLSETDLGYNMISMEVSDRNGETYLIVKSTSSGTVSVTKE